MYSKRNKQLKICNPFRFLTKCLNFVAGISSNQGLENLAPNTFALFTFLHTVHRVVHNLKKERKRF